VEIKEVTKEITFNWAREDHPPQQGHRHHNNTNNLHHRIHNKDFHRKLDHRREFHR
jgi:hypothetical protein